MSERQRIEPTPGDKRYVRRDHQGHFTEKDVALAAAADQRRYSTQDAGRGQGDRGDRQA